QVPIKLLRALRLVAGQARVRFQNETASRFQSRIDRSRFVRATNEKRGRSEQRKRERDLHHHQRMPRQKSPATYHNVFAGLLFEVADHYAARKFERGSKRESERAEQTETERRR